MSDTIDNRVVQLDLENASFERNAKKSIDTLDELDKALEFKNGKRGFDEVERAAEKTNFASLIKAADTVSERLSALGIIGVTALQNITNKAVDAGEKLIRSLSIDQVLAGYSKYEQKTASVQTLVNATGKSVDQVNEYLSKLMWFSDETSYKFTDMTQALSTMVTSGGDIEKLIPMIMGVANSVAFAGKGANEFSRVMYNLNQSYSAGALKYTDWKSVELAGAASKELKQLFIDTAVAQGKLKEGMVDVASFAMTLKDNWLDTEVMEKAFGDMAAITEEAYKMVQSGQVETAPEAYEILSKKYDTVAMRAALAAQQAKTLTEAIDSVKDAVSTGWMTTFEKIFGDYQQASKLWTMVAEDLWDIFASGGEKRNALLGEIFDSGFSKIQQSAQKAGIKVEDLQNAIMDVADGKGVNLDEAIHEYGSLDLAIRSIEGGADITREALMRLSGAQVKSGTATSDMLGKFEEYRDLTHKVAWGYMGDEATAMKRVTEAGYDWNVVQELLTKTGADLNRNEMHHLLTMEEYEEVASRLSPAVSEMAEGENDLAAALADANSEINQQLNNFNKRSGTEVIMGALHNIFRTIIAIKDITGTAWKKVFGDINTGAIFNALEAFEAFTDRVATFVEENDKVKYAFLGIATILKGFTGIVSSGFGVIGSFIKLLGRFVSYASKLRPIADVLSRIRTAISNLLGTGTDGLGSAAKWLDRISAALDAIGPEQFDRLYQGAKQFYGMLAPVRTAITKAYRAVVPFIGALAGGLGIAAVYLYNSVLLPFGQFVAELIRSKDPIGTVIRGLRSMWDWIKQIGRRGQTFLSGLFDGFKIGTKSDSAEKSFQSLGDIIDRIREKAIKLKDSLDFGTLLAGATVVGSFYGLSKLSKALTDIGNLAETVRSTFKNFNSILKSKLGSPFVNNIKIVASSLTMLAAAVGILALIPKDKLGRALLTLTVLTGLLAGLSWVLEIVASKLSKKDIRSLTILAKTMIAFAAAILVLAIAGKMIMGALADIEGFWDKMGLVASTVVYMVGMATALGVLAILLGKAKGKITLGAVALLLLAAGVWAFVNALGLLKNVNLGGMIGTVVGIAVAIGVIGTVMGEAGKATAKPIALFIAAIAGITAAFYLVGKALESMRTISKNGKWTGGSWAALIGTIFTVGLIGAAVGIAAKFIQPAVKSAATLAIGVLAIAGAMFLVELILERIAKMPTDTIVVASDAILKIGLAMAFMMAALGALSWLSDGGKGVLKIAVAMLLIVGELAIMMGLLAVMVKLTKKMSDAEIANAYGVLFGLVFMLGALMIATGWAAKLGGGKGAALVITCLGSMIVMVGLFAVVSTMLKSLSGTDILKSFGALAGLAAIIGVLALLVGFAASLPGEGASSVFRLIGIAAVIATVAASLAVLAQLPNGVADAAMAMGITLVAIAGALAMIEAWDVSWASVGKFALAVVGIGAAVWLIAQAMVPLASLDTGKLVSNLKAVGIAMGIMLGAVVILAIVVGVLNTMFAGAATVALLTVVGTIVGLAAAMLILSGAALILAKAAHEMETVDFAGLTSGLTMLGKAAGWAALGCVGLILAAVGLGIFALVAGASAGAIDSLTMSLYGLAYLLSAVGNAWAAGDGTIMGALANLGPALDESADKSSAAMEKLSGSFKEAPSDISDANSEIVEATEAGVDETVDAISGAAPEVSAAVEEVIDEAADTAKEKAPSIFQQIANYGKHYLSGEGKGMFSGLSDMGGFDVSSMLGSFGMDTSALQGVLGDSFAGVDMGAAASMLNFNIDPGSINTEGLTTAVQTATDTAFSGVDTNSSAQSFVQQFVSSVATFFGGAESTTAIRDAGENVANEAQTGAKSVEMGSTGGYFVQGFANGIRLNTYIAEAAARYMAAQAKAAADAQLNVRSPSREMMKTGGFFTEGFAIGIANVTSKAVNAAKNMATFAMAAVDSTMNDSRDYDGIVPVLDMSDVYNTMAEFDGVWRPTIRPTLDMSAVNPGMLNMNAVAAQQAAGYRLDGTPAAVAAQNLAPASFNFTQNNYSPKPLSRTEIYRQTKNQFASIEGLVNSR